MALIQQTIKNLIAGVSQQPPRLRHAEQLEEQINGFSTEAGGLQKRPPTLHIRKLPNLPSKSKVHLINRDTNEKYLVVFTGDGLRVFDMQGNERQVSLQNEANNYIRCNNPNTELKAITVADYTFIVNTTKRVEMNQSSKSPNSFASQGALIVIRQGNYGRTYTIRIGNDTYSYETPDGGSASHSRNIATDFITNELYNRVAGNVTKLFKDLSDDELRSYGITKRRREGNILTGGSYSYEYQGKTYLGRDTFAPNAVKGYKAIKGTNWIQLIGNTSDISISDGFNNEAMKMFTTSTPQFNLLPSTAPHGFTVLVKGEKASDDDYYVAFDSNDNLWKETIQPNIPTHFTWQTMPYILRREANGTFTCTTAEWNARQTGDEDSNPIPSFVGERINDIFFFRNRLGIVAGEAVNLSKSSDFFNFWVDSATGIVDTDPIDIQVSHNRVSTLFNAVPFNQDLYLFSGQTQFILRAEGVLSPKTAVIDQVTEFDADKEIKPIGVGKNLYFTAKKTNFTTVQEYYAVADSSTQKDSIDVTGHVPNYIPNTVYSLKACNNENILMVLSEAERGSIFVYKFLFLNDSKAQASWSKWTFDGTILGLDFVNSDMYMIINRHGNTFLEKISISYNTKDFSDEPYRITLDRKLKVTLQGTYNETERTMTYDIRGVYGDNPAGLMYGMSLLDGHYYEGYGKIVIPNQDAPIANLTCYVGIPYPFRFVYSTFYIKKTSETGTDTMPNDRLQLRFLIINYDKTGEFTVNVKAVGKPERNYKMTARYVGTGSNKLNRHPLETGEFKVPLMGKNTDVTVTVKDQSPLPSAFNNTVWQGLVTYRFRQV